MGNLTKIVQCQQVASMWIDMGVRSQRAQPLDPSRLNHGSGKKRDTGEISSSSPSLRTCKTRTCQLTLHAFIYEVPDELWEVVVLGTRSLS